MRRPLLPAVALAVALLAPPALAVPGLGGPPAPAPVSSPLLPFPSDAHTVEDPTTDTGRRVDLSPLDLPTNVAGVPWDPTEWNRNDGFSPGTPILAHVPGLDLRRTWGIDRDQLTDLSLSLRPDAPIALTDADTGERHPFWSELDSHPDTTDDTRLLIIRPARNLAEGHRYVVSLRGLRDGAGRPLPKQEWDFTVASRRNLTERVLAMRDETFAALGDTNLADGVVQGRPPAITIDEVVDDGDRRTVHGTIAVPNYLTHQIEVVLAAQGESLPVAAPQARLRDSVNPLQPSVDVPFDCHLPLGGPTPSDGLVYGHGLLGSRAEAGGSSTEDLRRRGFAPCAVDWLGMATADVANVGVILTDASKFPSLPDRAQQGFLHFLLLARAMAHPDGFAALPAFRDPAGKPLLRTGRVVYAGNSQGAIMGGALTALAPDFTRAMLGVPGMNYSTLLNRSVDWEGAYGEVLYAAYPDPIDRQLVFALLQMLWDRGEANGYAHHMTDDPLPGTLPHQVLLQVAYADHQVANVSAEVEARTIGARLVWPAFGAGWPHWSVDPRFGLDTAKYGPPGQSVIVYWWSADRGNTVPPTGNVPSVSGEDPHGDPRKDNRASDQVAWFLRTGRLVDVCGRRPCVTTEATRSNG